MMLQNSIGGGILGVFGGGGVTTLEAVDFYPRLNPETTDRDKLLATYFSGKEAAKKILSST